MIQSYASLISARSACMNVERKESFLHGHADFFVQLQFHLFTVVGFDTEFKGSFIKMKFIELLCVEFSAVAAQCLQLRQRLYPLQWL